MEILLIILTQFLSYIIFILLGLDKLLGIVENYFAKINKNINVNSSIVENSISFIYLFIEFIKFNNTYTFL
jgi:hypothetical protein